ncbi:MAG: tetratricopeptide repeat protein [Bryobacteraceae bacterium]
MKFRMVLAGLTFGLVALAADTGAELFQKALTAERAAGNLEEAIKLYQRVAKEFASDRALAAKALVQEARCYEKLGQDKAVKIYEQVARDFKDQREQASAARERLAAISPGSGQKSSGMVARRIPLPASARQVYSDGRHVFYVDRVGGGLIAAGMDGANPQVIFRLASGAVGGHIYASPDGRQVVFGASTTDDLAVCIAGVDGTGFRQLYRKPRPAVLPLGGWSPDGHSIILHVVGPDLLSVPATISVQDGSVHSIPNAPTLNNGPSLAANGGGQFSPDGRYVVFAASRRGGANNDILILAVDGSYQGKIADHPSRNTPLGFAPDGKHFLFQSDRSGKAGIYAVTVVNGRTDGEPVLIKEEAGMFSGGCFDDHGREIIIRAGRAERA